ncbi:MAG: MBL fold metallo-hydrolase [Chloroflexi bacterium]|nr:MBL fold metallo-hydrolase [Chloroflexota bacterium]
MIEPLQCDDAFIADVTATMTRREGVSLWWLGQSGYLIASDGVCIAVDPYLSDSLTAKYANTTKPHIRMGRRVIDPALLRMVSLVTSSHNHTDHLDGETIGPMMQANPVLQIVCSQANVAFASERLGVDVTRMTGVGRGSPLTHGPFRLHVIPAAHNTREQDADGHERYIGLIIEVGGRVIYHSGDTLWYPELVSDLAPWAIDVALLPINGNDPARGVAGNLHAHEAVDLAQRISATLLIPCHYDMFTFNTVNPSECVHHANVRAQQCRVLQLGERFDVVR